MQTSTIYERSSDILIAAASASTKVKPYISPYSGMERTLVVLWKFNSSTTVGVILLNGPAAHVLPNRECQPGTGGHRQCKECEKLNLSGPNRWK
jgi:hypothetical protein